MATETRQPRDIKEAHGQLRLAVEECQALLKRTEAMLHRSQQDNQPLWRPF